MKCKEMTIGSAICVFRYDNIILLKKVCFGLFFSHKLGTVRYSLVQFGTVWYKSIHDSHSEEDPDNQDHSEYYPYPVHIIPPVSPCAAL